MGRIEPALLLPEFLGSNILGHRSTLKPIPVTYPTRGELPAACSARPRGPRRERRWSRSDGRETKDSSSVLERSCWVTGFAKSLARMNVVVAPREKKGHEEGAGICTDSGMLVE